MDERAKEQLKADIIQKRGFWSPMHENLINIDPAALEAYLEYVTASSAHLSEKLRHLLFMAADASVTHLFEFGIRLHMDLAMQCGATKEEVFEVLQLLLETCGLGSRVGMPILAEELKRAGRESELQPQRALTERQARARDLYRQHMGHWPEWLDLAMHVAPDFGEAFVELTMKPWRESALDAKTKAFVLIAVYSAPTMRNEEYLREYIRLALTHGASALEISEVMQTASVISIHTYSVGVPILRELMKKNGG